MTAASKEGYEQVPRPSMHLVKKNNSNIGTALVKAWRDDGRGGVTEGSDSHCRGFAAAAGTEESTGSSFLVEHELH